MLVKIFCGDIFSQTLHVWTNWIGPTAYNLLACYQADNTVKMNLRWDHKTICENLKWNSRYIKKKFFELTKLFRDEKEETFNLPDTVQATGDNTSALRRLQAKKKSRFDALLASIRESMAQVEEKDEIK